MSANEPAPESTPVAVTRLAPSPTGALHLGNARTFLVNWAVARARGWRIVLRIEDLDTPRNKPDAAREALDVLAWLGIEWDAGPTYQSHDLDPYRAAMRVLASGGRVFSSDLSRGQIEAASSAPQEGDAHEVRFPPELRPGAIPRVFDDEGANWRFVADDEWVAFDDEFAGPQRHNPSKMVGDFVVWTARRQPAYQLAVVVDDARQGVTHVVRGDDLLESAARQVLIYRALRLGPTPRYMHLPLVRGEDGRRLAKRHGDTRIVRYREAGVSAERVVGLMAFWCGIVPLRRPMQSAEFKELLRLDSIPRDPITFTLEDDAWLRSRT